ncbi:MAG TPA: 50S ribosomal protein L6 [Candidatus Paceibacterota bacterium]|nr:50S ribosomal protein L6 [Candidatus Paceibacterota bacterium]
MSRIGKKPIALPKNTEARWSESDGVFSVKGPHGELSRKFKGDIAITIGEGEVTLAPKKQSIETNALWGTYASHIQNMVDGVNKPYEKKLVVEGVGFKWDAQGDSLNLSLGFSHPVKMKIPAGVTAKTEKNTLTLTSIDKDILGQFAAEVRALKKPEPYKGKGIAYEGEVIRRKQGKKAA